MDERKKRKILSELRRIVGKEYVETDEVAIKLYAMEASGLESSAIGVVFPENTKQISEIVRFAYENDLKIYPQGSATAVSGSSLANPDGIILCFARMNKVIEYSFLDGFIVVQPGIRLMEINDFLMKDGYMFPVDPASVKSATAGGLINTGGGGIRGALYGTAKEWIMGLELVIPDAEGSVIRIGCRTPKCYQGYDLVGLIVGSEGTLGIVTEATLRITPIPENIVTAVGFFDTLEQAMEAVIRIKKSKIVPYIMEFMDSKSVMHASKYIDLDWEVKGNMLIASIAGPVEASEKYLDMLEKCMRDAGALNVLKAETQEKAEKMRLFDLRRAYYPTAILTAALSLEKKGAKPLILLEDVAVPPTKLPEAVKRIRAMESKYNLPLVICGHVGDGNLHPLTWIDAGDKEARKRAWRMFMEIMNIALDLGGTISAEHGIGLVKREGLRVEFARKNSLKALELMRKIKEIFDPKGILNPGKIFPPDTK